MTFTRTGDLGFDPPVADAGSNVSATLSSSTVSLDGSGTYEPTGKTVTYTWSQVYGPTALTFQLPPVLHLKYQTSLLVFINVC